ncbi:MAG TPA: DUF2199 domain-containing protein [Longimicrobium sp.]|nr:DUF2199 domain-containing protein [Longimicrobium sp.]
MSAHDPAEPAAEFSFQCSTCGEEHRGLPSLVFDPSGKTHLHLQPVPPRPLVELEPADHPLAVDQREGIPPDRVRELMEVALHPEAGA